MSISLVEMILDLDEGMDVQQGPYLQGTPLAWWQKLLALASVVITIALAAVIGVIILYVLLVLIALAALVGAFFYLRYRFFPPSGSKPKPQRGPDNITIIETQDGVVIDVPVEPSDPKGSRGRHD